MEKMVVIKQQFALQERNYVKNGESRKFASLLNRKDEKGGEDEVDIIERHRTLHGG